MSLTPNFERHVTIDGIPAVEASKKAAFAGLLQKKIEGLLGHNNFTLKLVDGEEGRPIGCFMDCKTVDEADKVVAKLNKFHLTKVDVFNVYRWSDYRAAETTSLTYRAPDFDDEGNQMDLSNPHMVDKQARAQLLVKANDNFHCHWWWVNPNSRLTHVRAPGDLIDWTVVDQKAKKVQEGHPYQFPMFSPRGTYVITQAPGALRFYGGKGCNLLAEFPAPELKLMQVSPNEKYLVLYGREFTFWDIQNNKVIATIPGQATKETWPQFKYNSDDTLVATFSAQRGTVLIFDAATMQLQVQEMPPRHTIKEEGMSAFAWSPTLPDTFSYAVKGDESSGFRVMIETITLLEDKDELENMCSLRQLTRRNYFQTKDIELLWHPLGTHLAAKITKANDTTTYGIFKMTQYGAEAQAVEVKGDPLRFAWQPNSDRFSIITVIKDKMTTKQLATVSFFEASKAGFTEIAALKCSGVRMFWAPKGNHCVVVNFETSRLEFFGVLGSGPFPSKGKIEFIVSVEHPMITNVEWDPTGRYLCSWTSCLKYQSDNSYMIWDVNGNKLAETKTTKLSHCTWRPLAESLLKEADVAELKKRFPALIDKFNFEASEAQRKADELIAAKKKAQLEKYIKVMQGIHEHCKKEDYAERRAALIAKSPSMKKLQDVIQAAGTVTDTIEVDPDDE